MRTSLLLLVILASARAIASAQNPVSVPPSPDDGRREFVVSGCLLRVGYAGFQLDQAVIDAIDGKPVPKAAPSTPDRPGTPVKWMLEEGGNLGPRVGERVQVVGRSDWQAPSPDTAVEDDPSSRGPSLEVKSLKTVASSCK
jgi:hypothetical protein